MFLPATFNLGKAFKQYFEIVPALSDALRDHVYRIRHQVYCENWLSSRSGRTAAKVRVRRPFVAPLIPRRA